MIPRPGHDASPRPHGKARPDYTGSQTDDRRVVKTRITPQALSLLKTWTSRFTNFTSAVRHMSAARLKTLFDLLEEVASVNLLSRPFRTSSNINQKKEEKHMGRYLSRIAVTADSQPFSRCLPPGTSDWRIDPQHSSAQFAVRHMAISTVRGAFSKVNGTIVLDDKDISKSTSTSPLTSRPSTRVSQAVTTISAATSSLMSRTSRP